MEDDSRPLLPKSTPRLFEGNIFTRFVKPCVAEFLTTAIFVFVGTTSVQTGNGVQIALAHGMTITLLVLCFGDISGGHINPAVTVSVYLGSSLRIVTAVLYVICQLIGSIAGAALTRVALSFPVESSHSNQTVYEEIAGGTHHLSTGLSYGQGLLIEVILTFILCQSVLLTAVDRKSPFAAFAIGLSVFVDIAIGGNLTGGSMNPARSFGPAVVFSDLSHDAWTYHYIYWVGPIIGAAVAAALYRFCLASGKDQFIRRLRRQSEGTLNAD